MRILAATAVFLVAPTLHAQTVCPKNDIELFPFDGSVDVPRDPVVRVLYRDPAHAPGVSGGEAERVIEVYDGDLRLAGSATLENDATGVGREAVWTGESLFPASTALSATFEDEFGTPTPFAFTTGDSVDSGAPDFSGATQVEIVESDPVIGAADGYRVRVTFRLADDDVGGGNVEYVVYQTDGPEWTQPVERERVRCVLPGGSGIAAFVVPKADIGRWACFQVRAVDSYGNSEDNDHEACGIPEGPGYFRSCSTAGPPGAKFPAVILGAFALSLRRRRRR